jgi:hypothetical protein
VKAGLSGSRRSRRFIGFQSSEWTSTTSTPPARRSGTGPARHATLPSAFGIVRRSIRRYRPNAVALTARVSPRAHSIDSSQRSQRAQKRVQQDPVHIGHPRRHLHWFPASLATEETASSITGSLGGRAMEVVIAA